LRLSEVLQVMAMLSAANVLQNIHPFYHVSPTGPQQRQLTSLCSSLKMLALLIRNI